MTKLALKVVLIVAPAACFSVSAQEFDQLHLDVGEAKLYPSVTLEYVSNDNVLRNQEAVASSGVVVAPQALFIADRRGLEVQFGYKGNYGAFEESSINYNDHQLFANADAVFGVRKRGSLDAYIRKSHQSLGQDLTRDSSTIGDEPVEFVDMLLNSQYTYGALTAKFNVSAGVRLFNRSYQNRVDVAEGRDLLEIAPFGQFSYRLSADTRALIQLRFRSLSFDDSNRDRDELQLLAGLSFRGGGKLSGVAKLGVSQPDYVDTSREDELVLTVDTTLTYQPSSLSTFDFQLVRELDNGGSLNDGADVGQIIDDTVSLTWEKKWSGFVSSTALLEAALEGGGCPVDRSDTVKAAFDIRLKATRWMTFGLGVASTTYTESQCDSVTQTDNDYDLVELKAFITLAL